MSCTQSSPTKENTKLPLKHWLIPHNKVHRRRELTGLCWDGWSTSFYAAAPPRGSWKRGSRSPTSPRRCWISSPPGGAVRPRPLWLCTLCRRSPLRPRPAARSTKIYRRTPWFLLKWLNRRRSDTRFKTKLRVRTRSDPRFSNRGLS